MANQTIPAIQIKDSNVGIGYTNPLFAKLAVNGDIGLGLYGTANTSFIIGPQRPDGAGFTNTPHISFKIDGNTNGRITFSTIHSGTAGYPDAMTVNFNGNVLIGTTTDAGYKLDVNGTGRFSGANLTIGSAVAATNVKLLLNGVASKAAGIEFQQNGTSQWYIGNGIASEDNNFELYNSNGTMAMKIIKSTNAINFIGTFGVTGAATFSSSVEATSFIKTSGTSSQYLMADGSVSTLTNPVTGTGTTNYVPKFTSASAIGNSQIFDNGTNVGIGTTSPSNKLHIRQTGIVDNTATTLLLLDGQFQDSSIEEADMVSIGFRVENSSGGSQTSQAISFAYNNILSLMKDGGNVLIGTTTDSGYKLAVNGTITSANYSYLSTYGYGATQLRTYEISTGTSVSDNQVFNLYLGRFGNGYHRITLWGTGYGTDSGNYFDITRTWNGTPYIITNGGLIMGGAQYTIHWAAVDSGKYDLFIKWYAGMPTGQSNVINYAIQSNTGYQYVQFDYPGGVTVPTLDGSNLVASRMTIQYTTGNVGIGTTSPAATLDVNGSIQAGSGSTFGTGSNGASIYMSSASSLGLSGNLGGYSRNLIKTDGTSVIEIGDTGTSIITAINISAGDATGVIALKTGGNNTRLYVNSSGNVGIGTTSPTGTYGKLSVAGGISILNDNNAKLEIGRYSSGTSNSYIKLGANSNSLRITNNTDVADIFTIENGGNVGIGTTAPGTPLGAAFGLVIDGNTNTDVQIRLQTNSTGRTSADGGLLSISGLQMYLWNYEASNLIFGTNNAESARILSNGNVGIGTTAPNARLDLGSTQAGGIQFLYDSNQTYRNQIYNYWDSSTDSRMDFNIGRTANVAPVTIMSVGYDSNVGIGTTAPTEKLHVVGSTLITYNNSFQSTNSVGNKAILARVSPTSGIINYAEYATATNLNGFVIGSDDARVKGNITGDSLEFITNTSTRMTILSSGNVGINTTTPGSTLHVIGDVLIQTGALGVGVNPNATDGRIDASNDIVAFSTSDKRLKENITPIANALEKVRSLTGVEFDWKEETKSVHGYEGHDVGVIAQDVQAVLPEAVRTNDSGYLSVRYEKMIALLVEANKELADRVEQLEKLIK